jgi:PAS domain S-box-containing protein
MEILNIINASVSVYWKDSEGKYIGCNDYMRKIHGYQTMDQIIGKTDNELSCSDASEYLKNIESQVIIKNCPHTIQEIVSMPDGTKKVFLTIKAPFPLDDNKTGIIGISIDLSDQAIGGFDLDTMDKLMHNKITMMLRELKHDIRNPIGSILMLAGMIQDDSQDPKTISNLKKLYESTESLNNFVDSLSNDLENNNSELQTNFDLCEVVSDVFNLFKSRAVVKKINTTCVFERIGPLMITANQDRLCRILVELVNNAIKYTDAGEVSIRIYSSVEQNQQWANIVISDTGIGMRADSIDKLTKPASNLDYKSLNNGNGFGLSLVNTLIKSMGIEVKVDSQEGKGTNIILKIKHN